MTYFLKNRQCPVRVPSRFWVRERRLNRRIGVCFSKEGLGAWKTGGLRNPDWLRATLKENSEGLLLLAAGCALLLRSGQSIGRTECYRSDAQEYLGDEQSALDDMPHQSTIGDWANEASRIPGNVREHVSSVGKNMSETAADYAASVSQYAHGTREKAVLDAQQKAVDDIRAGRPPYYFTAPASSVSGSTTASRVNEPDAEKK
jgi:hypothetical protein